MVMALMDCRIIKRRILLFLMNIFVCFLLIINTLNSRFLPIVSNYGSLQCNNMVTKIITYMVERQLKGEIQEQIVVYYDKEPVGLEFNTAILNSILNNSIKLAQKHLYKLEKGEVDKELLEMAGIETSEENIKRGIVYEIPLSRVFNNVLIGNLGVNVPVRFKLAGEVFGKIISNVREYGINNAIVEISLEISSKFVVLVPIISKEERVVVSVPVVMRIIQGEIPDSFYGSHILEGEK